MEQGAADSSTLLLFAHPKCPCTRATLGELERLLADAPGAAAVTVFFYRPSEEPAAWARTDTWDRAAALPGVQVREDVDGAQARLFGAAVSGEALLYRAGLLRFEGEEIVRSAAEMATLGRQMAGAQQEQSKMSREIADSVRTIERVSRETTRRLEDISAAGAGLLRTASKLRELLQGFGG